MSPFMPTCSTSSRRTTFMRLRPPALQRSHHALRTARAVGSAPGPSFLAALAVGRDRRDLAVGLRRLEPVELFDGLGAVLDLLLGALGRSGRHAQLAAIAAVTPVATPL